MVVGLGFESSFQNFQIHDFPVLIGWFLLSHFLTRANVGVLVPTDFGALHK